MENKLEKIGQNSFMDNFVKTDDILKDMLGVRQSDFRQWTDSNHLNI